MHSFFSTAVMSSEIMSDDDITPLVLIITPIFKETCFYKGLMWWYW